MLVPLLERTNGVKFWWLGSQPSVGYHPAPSFAQTRIKGRNTSPGCVSWCCTLGKEPAAGTSFWNPSGTDAVPCPDRLATPSKWAQSDKFQYTPTSWLGTSENQPRSQDNQHGALERYFISKWGWLGTGTEAGGFWDGTLQKLQEQIFCFYTLVTCLGFFVFCTYFSDLLVVWKLVLRCVHLDSLWNMENFSNEMGSSASTKKLL